MKKLIILILPTFILFTANAQKTYFGIKGGLNVSSLHINDDNALESKIGFHVGALAHIHASKTWAIQPEVFYSLEGAKGTLIGNNNKVTYNLNYINVPVLLQRFFHNGLRVEAGPQLGFLISAKTKTGSLTVDNKGFQSTAISIPLGVGYLTSEGLGFDARYVFGLSNINEDEKGSTVQGNVFQFGIFYQFGDTKMHHR
ncbi:MAG: porin family protein [Ginsengibacter sp.]